MAVTLTKRQIGKRCVELHFTSDLGGTPEFRVWVDGQHLLKTQRNSCRLSVERSAVVDVLDDDTVPLTPSGQTRLEWNAVAGAEKYVVEKDDGGWSEYATVEDVVTNARVVLTIPASDTEEDYRVKTVNADNGESSPVQVTARQEAHPAPPRVSFAFSDTTKKATITEI